MVCQDCKKPLNPVEAVMGPVCGKCVDKRHRKAVGK